MGLKIISVALLCCLWGTAAAEPTSFNCDVAGTKIHCEADKKDKLPPLKSGFVVDLRRRTRDGLFYVGVELLDWTWGSEAFSLDLGLTSGRANLGISWGAWYGGKVAPFIWVGYNIAADAPAYGIGLTVLKL